MSASNDEERHVQAPQMMTHVDPYLYQMLQQCMDRVVVVQTIKDSVRGTLKSVYPDHVVVEVERRYFHIRMQQVIWVLPE
ncbi:DUF2642 domain-containing protein [Virgibacillus sp. C22-A2]|uniref:DUF2642 domain-containing protein n=1 Tax=Virgibacillus tibetensis TaxID=3042313 RepID=A0ABU6KGJ8_9BACI|nr:DUF2642 domain-containing protein [Virgibacillus sp. C22-A2]